MKTTREFIHNLKELPREELLAPGSSLCAGCGALATVRLLLNALDGHVVVVNAAGCLTMLAAFPYTPLRCSWLYTTMSSAPAGAQGVRDALDILIAKGRLPAEENLQIVVVAGDGATLDIGLSSLSGAIHRGLDFYYLCYDNEAYGNTGFQMSSGSPFASQTATSPVCQSSVGSAREPDALARPLAGASGSARQCLAAGTQQSKKDLFAIWLAHRPPYIATLCSADPVDLTDKVRRARQFRGPKLFHALATCPTGWGFDPSQGHHLAKLALQTGVWPLKEAVHGQVRHTYIPDHRRPVEEYLSTQRRFRHLFVPRRQEEVLREIQESVDAYWREIDRSQRAAGPLSPVV